MSSDLFGQSPTESDEILIVYLSRTANIETVAEIIQQEVGGKLTELGLENPYPDDYNEIVAQVDRENQTGYPPTLKTRIENMQDYDTVFLGRILQS